MKKLMYKVMRIDSGKIVMFESKADAVEYVEMLKEKAVMSSLSHWRWETTVED